MSYCLPGELPLSQFRLHFRGARPYVIQGYRGSAWRGVLGTALKRRVCIARESDCAGCRLRPTCLYPYIFETPELRVAGAQARMESAPHPYLLAVEPDWRPRVVKGETVGVTLVGRGTASCDSVVGALSEGAARGVGADRMPLELVRVEQRDMRSGLWRQPARSGGGWRVLPAQTPPTPAMPELVRLTLVTPLRIRRENDLVEPERLSLEEFVAAVLRRLALLTRSHTGAMWRMDHAGLRQAAARARVLGSRLCWQDWARYSNRQGRKVPMGGVVGEMLVSMEGLEAVWPLIWTGQWVHAGKGAVMGLGKYELRAA